MTTPALLVIIGGAPGTGKTTLGGRIAQDFALPYFSKDAIKETLFDVLGWRDVAWSRQLGMASIALLFSTADAELAAQRSLIMESNFRPEFDTQRFADLLRQHPARVVQVFCHTAPAVLVRRFQQRWESGVRHPGHVEHEQMDDFAARHIAHGYAPLAIGGTLHAFDTTDFATLDLEPLYAAIRTALGAASAE